MKRLFKPKTKESIDTLMNHAGYNFHCNEKGKSCYHRRITEWRFPRFHALTEERKDGLLISLHIDQFNRDHQSNHDKEWAYHGGRVDEEMNRLVKIIEQGYRKPRINRPQPKIKKESNKKKSIFEILFK